MKKLSVIIKVFVALMLLGLLSPVQSLAAETIMASGTTASGVDWRVNSDMELVIGKVGETQRFEGEFPWTTDNSNPYAKAFTTVRFEGTVTHNGCLDYMFTNCDKLQTINWENFDGEDVTRAYVMFAGCTDLVNPNLQMIDLSKLVESGGMFSDCTNLKRLDLSTLSTLNASTYKMFTGCKSLSAVVFGGSFKFSSGLNTITDYRLPTPPSASTTQKWIKKVVPNGTYAPVYLSYDFTDYSEYAGEWVWETKEPTSDFTVSEVPDVIYTGEEHTPHPDVYWLGQKLRMGTDYTLAFSDNVVPGEGTIKVNGLGRFYGTKFVPFNIQNAPISLTEVEVAECSYTGEALTPELTVTYDGAALVLGEDYTASFRNNIDAGTATATLTGRKPFEGTKTVKFSILPASICEATVQGVTSRNYTGSEITQTPVVSMGKTKLIAGTDYEITYENNINVGTAYCIINGLDNYAETLRVPFEIVVAGTLDYSLDLAEIEPVDAEVYDGSAHTPSLTVKLNGELLLEGVDYSVTYENNIDVGQAKAIVQGIGERTGSNSVSFRITPASLSDVQVLPIDDIVFTNSVVEPAITIKLCGSVVDSSNYTVSYFNNEHAGTATAMIVGQNNLKGRDTISFSILPQSIKSASVAQIGEVVATGDPIEPLPKLSYKGMSLVQGIDFTVSYSSNITGDESGYGTVTINGIGDFTGATSIRFRIKNGYDIGDDMHAAVTTLPDQIYTGREIKPQIEVTWDSEPLQELRDYTVTYNNNVQVGKATITIEGLSPFVGTKVIEFFILPAEQNMSIRVASDTLNVGDSMQLVIDGAHTVVRYNSSDPDVAVVDSNGVVHALQQGTVEISVTASAAEGYKSASCIIGLTVENIPVSIPVFEDSVTLSVGATASIDTSSFVIEEPMFSSQDQRIATVTTAGVVTGKQVGTTKIVVKTGIGNTRVALITIKVTPAKTSSVTLTPTTTGIKVEWKKVAGATGYYVYRNGTLVTTIKSGSTISYLDKKAVSNGIKYTYEIKAYASTGESDKIKTATTYYLTRPEISSITSPKKAQIKLSWGKNAKATGYQIQYSTTKSFTEKKSVSITKNTTVSKLLSSLEAGQTYYVRIRAYKTVSGTKYYSPWSVVKTIKVK